MTDTYGNVPPALHEYDHEGVLSQPERGTIAQRITELRSLTQRMAWCCNS